MFNKRWTRSSALSCASTPSMSLSHVGYNKHNFFCFHLHLALQNRTESFLSHTFLLSFKYIFFSSLFCFQSAGEAIFTTPGTFSWVAPTGVNLVSAGKKYLFLITISLHRRGHPTQHTLTLFALTSFLPRQFALAAEAVEQALAGKRQTMDNNLTSLALRLFLQTEELFLLVLLGWSQQLLCP